jgi:pilus assembly protein Flp/PilA
VGAFTEAPTVDVPGTLKTEISAMITATLYSFVKDETGATAIEYSLIAALVSVASILALQALGGSLSNIFGVVGSHLDDVASQANGG